MVIDDVKEVSREPAVRVRKSVRSVMRDDERTRKPFKKRSYWIETRAYRSSPCDRVNARLVYGRGNGVRKATRGLHGNKKDRQDLSIGADEESVIKVNGGVSSWE